MGDIPIFIKKGGNMQEKREHKRHLLNPQPMLINSETGEDGGKVVDISPHGMQISTNKRYKTGATEVFTIVLSEQIFGKKIIEVEASIVWQRDAEGTEKYSYGLDFVSVDPQDEGILIALIFELEQDSN